MPNAANERQYGPQYKLIGKNYTTADLLAKVLGKSKYAEDFRAEGMLFCKLLLSPLPHARVKHIDASEALDQGDIAERVGGALGDVAVIALDLALQFLAS